MDALTQRKSGSGLTRYYLINTSLKAGFRCKSRLLLSTRADTLHRKSASTVLPVNMFAIKGANRPDIPYTAPPKKQKIVVNGKVIGQVWVYEIGVNAGKQKIVDNLRVQSPGANYCHFPLRDDYGKQFFKQLMSEHLAYVPKLKHPWQWQKIPGHERNEAFDIRNYNLAACEILSPDWDAIEQKLRTAKPGEENASIPMKEKKAKPRKRKKSEFYDDW